MRFAFFGYDYSVDIAQALMARGHDLCALFTFPCDQVFAFNRQTYALADEMNIPITDERVRQGHIEALLKRNCEVFLVAGYPRKIPPLPAHAYGINIHPALLPRARGITPVPYILLREPEAAGFTVHKLSPEYDAGDILYQEAITVDAHTDVEILSSRVALRARAVIPEIFDHLPAHWAKAKPQDERRAGSYPAVTEDLRRLDWYETAAALRRKGAAFGRYGVIAHIKNNVGHEQKLGVFQFTAWEEKHNHPIGSLMRSAPREVVISIADGYALLKDFEVVG